MNDKYNVVALFGKAGSGKDYFLHKIMTIDKGNYNDFHEIISCTTRPPRETEKNGVDYHFLSIDEFTKKLLGGEMLEASSFNDWYYGTSFDSLDKNKINIGVFNLDGIEALKLNPAIKLIPIWIMTDDKIRLLRQLNREENPNITEIIRRFKADEDDFSQIKEDFKCHRIFNDYQKMQEKPQELYKYLISLYGLD